MLGCHQLSSSGASTGMKLRTLAISAVSVVALSAVLYTLVMARSPIRLESTGVPLRQSMLGRRIPEFSVTDVTGRTFSVPAKGTMITVVNLWATWCNPCVHEMPRFQNEIANRFGSNVLIVAIAGGELPETILRFNASRGLTFPLVADRGRLVTNLFARGGIPITYVLDQRGVVLHEAAGADAFDSIPPAIEKTLRDAGR
jgi:peroxiredoxin